VVVQHEYDHLNGILFVDRLGTIAKLKVKRKLKELERKAVNGVNLRGED
jgi:peptide deformylase